MNMRALLAEPMVLAALSSLLTSAPQPEARGLLWLRRGTAAFGGMALVSGLVAGAVWLGKNYPLEQAALLFALYTALVAILCFVSAYAWQAWRATRMLRWPKKAMEKLENTTDFALNELGALAKDYPKTAAALLALAGYLAVSQAAAGTEKLLSALDLKINNLKRDTDHE